MLLVVRAVASKRRVVLLERNPYEFDWDFAKIQLRVGDCLSAKVLLQSPNPTSQGGWIGDSYIIRSFNSIGGSEKHVHLLTFVVINRDERSFVHGNRIAELCEEWAVITINLSEVPGKWLVPDFLHSIRDATTSLCEVCSGEKLFQVREACFDCLKVNSVPILGVSLSSDGEIRILMNPEPTFDDHQGEDFFVIGARWQDWGKKEHIRMSQEQGIRLPFDPLSAVIIVRYVVQVISLHPQDICIQNGEMW